MRFWKKFNNPPWLREIFHPSIHDFCLSIVEYLTSFKTIYLQLATSIENLIFSSGGCAPRPPRYVFAWIIVLFFSQKRIFQFRNASNRRTGSRNTVVVYYNLSRQYTFLSKQFYSKNLKTVITPPPWLRGNFECW